jgi:hypothetical protein
VGCFQPDSFLNARVIMSDQIEQRSSPRRHGNRESQAMKRDLKMSLVCKSGALGTRRQRGMVPA